MRTLFRADVRSHQERTFGDARSGLIRCPLTVRSRRFPDAPTGLRSAPGADQPPRGRVTGSSVQDNGRHDNLTYALVGQIHLKLDAPRSSGDVSIVTIRAFQRSFRRCGFDLSSVWPRSIVIGGTSPKGRLTQPRP
jgi:hypothetical protein